MTDEAAKLRAELAEWKTKASPHCHDCREYRRACEITGGHEALVSEISTAHARIAEVETALRIATEAAEAQKVYAGVAEARIAELEAAQQYPCGTKEEA